jgi:hypothetical protein
MKKSISSVTRKLSVSRLIGSLTMVITAAIFINALPDWSVKAQSLPKVFADRNFKNLTPAAVAPSLGTAAGFAGLAGSTVTNTGLSFIGGNLGVSPGTAITGFPPGVVDGTIHASDAVAIQAQSDTTVAYNNLAEQACDVNLTGQNLGGLTLTPGTYCFDSNAALTGTLTLDGQGNPFAVFIFKIGSTLTTSSNSSVVMINDGSGCNVFFQVGSSATLNTNTSFMGNILAFTSITLQTGTNIDTGRALAINGALTLDTNNVSSLGCAYRPSAAMTNVSGRVTTANGRGISRALVRMTDSSGVVRAVYTTPFGYYRFQDVEVGQTLILEVKAKAYNFTEPTKVVSLNEELAAIDFIAHQIR